MDILIFSVIYLKSTNLLVQAIYIDMMLPDTEIKKSFAYHNIGTIFEVYGKEIGEENLRKRKKKKDEEKSFLS